MQAPGTILQGRYRIVRAIGEGGMGAVYLAVDEKFDSTVALKENHYDDDRLSRAFEREARTLNRLRHPALPKVLDHFTEQGGQFLVMEFIPGDDLGAVLDKRRKNLQPKGKPKPFETGEVLRWAEQLLDTLDYLHAQQPPIIHRDIKPQNLKLADRGQITLLDFGLSKGTPIQLSRVTSSGSIFGYTPSYAPIEQIQGGGTDARSDLYSLGATLYHLLTGEPPIDALTRAASVLEGKPDPLRPVSHFNPDVPIPIASVLMQAMALNRHQRPATASQMQEFLREAVRAPRAVSATDAKRSEKSERAQAPPDEAETERLTPDTRPPSQDETTPSAQSKTDEPPVAVNQSTSDALAFMDRRETKPADPSPDLQQRPSPVAFVDRREAKPAGEKIWLVVAGIAMLIAVVILAVWALRPSDGGPITSTTEGPPPPPDPPLPEMREALSFYLEVGDDSGGNVVNKRPATVGANVAYDYFRLKFTPREKGYLYIIGPGAEAGTQETYLTDSPSSVSGVRTNRIEAGREFQFPDGEDGWIQIERNSLTYTIIFSADNSRLPDFLRSSSGRRLTETERKEIESLAQKSKIETGSERSVIKAPVSSPGPLIFDITISRR
ncbi:MAG: protein kinase [Acidobacteriota bacterium]